MKKSLIALAALAATGAFAQSTVTISGTYTASYQKDLTGTTANPVVIAGLANASNNLPAALTYGVSRGLAVTDANFRLSGTEDLGGGLRASFDALFETGAQRGAPVTRADSGVSLAGGFGTLAFRNTRGSDLIATVYAGGVFLADGIYDSTGIVTRSAIDTLGYTSPELIKGLRASITLVENSEGNITRPTTNKAVHVLGVTYADGPLSVAAAYKTKPTDAAASSGLTGKGNLEFAASYDFGVARVAYGYDAASVSGTSSASAGAFSSQANAQAIANLQTKTAQGFSVTVPMGALTLGAHYFKRGDAKLADLGAAYALSKRTSLTAAAGKKSGLNADLGFQGNQYRVGVRHTF